ncbi:class II aldolase/adducin family protein [Rhodanobacter sp. L36]|uniref:class II aldolase/adducin family protein n=1 Tax=Rhodanobacter sp. L36 TaxID=1747221 RepID=UPI00131AB10E|nr:class II aldolase/adducin family protein [Rhodanobacter sp. L36]
MHETNADLEHVETESELRQKVATMCMMLNLQGSVGMFGHVSIRVPGTERILLSPGAGSEKGAVTPEQVFVFHLNGDILEHPGGEVPLEWRIHTQIHRDRPEIMSITHLHAQHSTLLGIAGREIVPVFLHGAFLHTGVPTWDDPRLVVNDAQAASLSAALGDHVAIQQRGHGSVVVGETAEIAFFRSTFLEENARKQVEAEILGGALPLRPEEAADCARGTFNPRLLRLLWNYYQRKAEQELANQVPRMTN